MSSHDFYKKHKVDKDIFDTMKRDYIFKSIICEGLYFYRDDLEIEKRGLNTSKSEVKDIDDKIYFVDNILYELQN